MIEMPPLQFAETNGIRMGYYEAGPEDRHAAGHSLPWLARDRVLLASPDQGAERGRHSGDRAGPARLWLNTTTTTTTGIDDDDDDDGGRRRLTMEWINQWNGFGRACVSKA